MESIKRNTENAPMPHGLGDRNREPFRAPQQNNKVFQQYWGAQQNPPVYGSGYSYDFPTAPFARMEYED